MCIDADNVTVLNHQAFVNLLFSSPEALQLVNFAQLSDDLKELIGSTRFLRLEEREPEDNSVSALKL